MNQFGILFDLDGTLIDNEHLKAKAFSKGIKLLGGKSHPSLYMEVMGMDGETISNFFIKSSGHSIDLKEYRELYFSLYTELLKTDLIIRNGVVPFLEEIKDKGLKLSVVSSANAFSVNYIITTLNLENYFNIIITGNDVSNKKPNPDCYLLALDKLSLHNKQTVIIEDSEAGIKSANNAKISSIAIRHAYNQHHDFSKAFAMYDTTENEFPDIRKSINNVFKTPIF